MIRYILSAQVLMLYIIWAAGKIHPHPLTPANGWFDYSMLVLVGINTLVVCAAVLRWKALDD